MHFVDQINNFKIGKRKCLDMANTIDEIDYVQNYKSVYVSVSKMWWQYTNKYHIVPPLSEKKSLTTQTLPLVIPSTKHARVTSEYKKSMEEICRIFLFYNYILATK